MHRCLQIKTLDTLPGSLRRLASPAAAGSLEHLVNLNDQIGSLPVVHCLAIIPAFYANLDPIRIPSVTQLDDFTIPTQRTVARARVSLNAFSQISIVPPSAFPELWPRLWPWYQFFLSHGDLETLEFNPEFSDEESVCIDFLHFVNSFRGSDSAVQTMLATPDFRFAVTRTWVVLPHCQNGEWLLPVYDFVAHFLFHSIKAASWDTLKEILAAVGGHSNDITALVVDFIQDLLLDDESPVHEHFVVLLAALFDFITDIQDAWTSHFTGVGRHFQVFMAPSEVGVITRMAYALIQPTPGGDELLDRCLTLICQLLNELPGTAATYAALDNKLMRVIVALGVREQKIPQIETLLDQILPASLAYYHNLESMDTALSDVRPTSPAAAPAPEYSWYRDKWKQFETFADKRLKIYQHFMDGLTQTIRACDNIECTTIAPNVQFRRCSRCRSSYYCSYECQKLDWRTGGHREHCTRDSAYRLCESQNFNVRERSFLRDALLKHDYDAAKYSTIYPQKVIFMAAHPDEQLFTFFDYTAGPLSIEIHSTTGAFAQDFFSGDAEWRHDVERAARSGGRMQLDVMVIRAGDRAQYLVIPLRQSLQVHETLKRLALESPFAREPVDLPQLIEQIRDLSLKLDLECIQIH
ncbi:hypothetical protein DFH06DRAFT_1476486 [Mycena polygramma]|nr:hypothetical protein DFH06DRAFT_1476486 [Mycena polygramma]